ncbi:septum site-determining protein MinC [Candidatus Nitrotoga arctica]|uniref:Probable septum site-determining protein MinC n=1 Tax=Candidatus Nitrotoga arctica TaxID=453162 RepID=A0ABN8AKE6_9PROT|nr:septum site-determining protein MinC [Candidatus Nitrotoga arctica]CAG9932344.1 putative septum site-determining protein MinC [Candidatus Nitrotoga arctica]
MAREEPAFKLKIANLSLFVLYINTTDMDQLKKQLDMRFNQTQNFFSNTPVALDLSAIANFNLSPDFTGLMSFMLDHGMHATGVVGGSAEQREAAVQAGLGLFPDTIIRPPLKTASIPATAPCITSDAEDNQPELPGLGLAIETGAGEPNNNRILDSDTQLQKPVSQALPTFRPTMIINKPVRTGQRIYAEGANLVVLGVVNAGAELIADGDIHIYAPLRGRAIAGAQGNESARIFMHSLEAELISIAGCFKVFENGIPENLRGKPVQVHLDCSDLIIQPLLS